MAPFSSVGASAKPGALHSELVAYLRGQPGTDEAALIQRAQDLVDSYRAGEALHRDPDASADVQPGEPAARIELF